MLDFIRIACISPRISLGAPLQNAETVCKEAAAAAEQGADLAVFPELCLSGYACGDLFFQQALLEGSKEALARVARQTSALPCAVAVGLPLALEGKLLNCGALLLGGRVLGLVPKTFLPNYNEFYEARWFASAGDLTAQSLSSTELGLEGSPYEIPIGRNLIFDLGQVRVGLELCEDLWAPLPPSTYLALAGAEVLLNLSASNETIGKGAYRKALVSQQSARCLCAYAYASAGAGESTTDVVYSGACLIYENGACLGQTPPGVGREGRVLADVDLGRLRADRLKSTTYRDCAALYPREPGARVVRAPMALRSDGSLYPLRKLPFVPSDQAGRLARCREIFEMQVAGLARRLELLGTRAVIGVSGGLDSTLALLVAAEAMRRLGRPASEVVGVTMPCYGTTDRTHRNALELMAALGVTAHEIPVGEAVALHFRDIGHDPAVLDGTYENSQARERTQVLMDYASQVGGIVVGTGDLSELALGWCTYNGDHMSMYGVNASIPKTLVRWMIDAIAREGLFPGSEDTLRDILDTPISPELLPPDAAGKIAQVTEDLVGPYALHDFFLYHMLRYGFGPEKLYALACRAFREDFDEKTVLKWLRAFSRRFFTQQYKRSCLPDGVKVGSVCLSPRGDWRMPSDASGADWMARLDRLEAEHV